MPKQAATVDSGRNRAPQLFESGADRHAAAPSWNASERGYRYRRAFALASNLHRLPTFVSYN